MGVFYVSTLYKWYQIAQNITCDTFHKLTISTHQLWTTQQPDLVFNNFAEQINGLVSI